MAQGDSPHAPTLSGESGGDRPEFAKPPADPMLLLREWVDEAVDRGVREPLALALATGGMGGELSTRIVLVKSIDDRGLVFGTSRHSRKGRELERDPSAAGTLYWRETMQQVSVAGRIEPTTDSESDALFAERTIEARAATAASRQSEPLNDLEELRTAVDELLAGGNEITRPDHWGGMRLIPEEIEFWHGRDDRLHRRLRYTRSDAGWSHELLQP